jgi:hypothetical protein
MIFIYVLELENKKYYIGKTTNPDFRLEQHFNFSGSQWTKKYKPIKILELKSNCDDYDEEKYTINIFFYINRKLCNHRYMNNEKYFRQSYTVDPDVRKDNNYIFQY